jgi:hypothetical protein
MALDDSFEVKRAPDTGGDVIKVFSDAEDRRIQAIAFVDSDGNFVGADELVIVSVGTVDEVTNVSSVDVVDEVVVVNAVTSITNEVEVNNAKAVFDHGSKSSIGTSAVQMTESSITAKQGIVVKAARGNTGVVYVGNSDVTADTVDDTDGFELSGGESVTIPVNNANKVYVRASASGQRVYWVLV